MANVQTKTENKKVEAKVETTKVEVPKMTIADTVRVLGTKVHKDRATLAIAVVDYLAKKGITKNIKGKTIDVQHVTSQIGAIVNCINVTQRPKIWGSYTLVEDDKQFVIALKK